MSENILSEMTLYRALTALKTLDDKIKSRISTLECCQLYSPTNTDILETERWAQQAKSSYQSIVDLIEYRRKIKSAISLANSQTKVKIGSQEMTIAEALEMKSAISYKQDLIRKLENHYKITENRLNEYNQEKNRELATHYTSRASMPEYDLKKYETEFRKATKVVINDPIGIEKLIPNLKDEIADFIENVDVALAEINAKTTIYIK